MKKKIISILLASLFLTSSITGCTRPAGQTGSDTPSSEVVSVVAEVQSNEVTSEIATADLLGSEYLMQQLSVRPVLPLTEKCIRKKIPMSACIITES